jgi:hypothetical protein
MAFTEQGVAMLSSVLNSKRAIKVNIQIIRIFTRMRQILADHTDIILEIEKIKNKLEDGVTEDRHGKMIIDNERIIKLILGEKVALGHE